MKMWIPLEHLDWIRLAITYFQKSIKFTPGSSALPRLDLMCILMVRSFYLLEDKMQNTKI